ncbi:hypothetical protein DIURU_003848 [Diutina rugosa]|uniref:RRM domain-containing protein n=1 Tax=Diutina rugosa TaxID=5481 RepID=A0A642UJW3_DIURU|nr:uncharacterized protein DIURU_003848 [Diutina rugosa]KAA8900425.1 hypothetical protein DIURU_003848 [Diutina rugosa]
MSNKVAELNRRELENNVSDDASWHYDYRDTAYIYIGNLPPISKLDILRVFSQYGIPTHVHIVTDKDQRPRGFAYLKYHDPRSCVLAVDNLNGVKIMDKSLRVDHAYYKLRPGDSEDNYKVDYSEVKQIEAKPEVKPVDESKLLKQSAEVSASITVVDDDLADPMAQFEAETTSKKDEEKDRETEEKSDEGNDDTKENKDNKETPETKEDADKDNAPSAPRKRFRRAR